MRNAHNQPQCQLNASPLSSGSAHTEQPADDTVTPAEAVAIVATLHSDTLAVDAASITRQRADSVVAKAQTQTTTELLLLLARFHEGVDDPAGAALLARFAVEFAALESTTV